MENNILCVGDKQISNLLDAYRYRASLQEGQAKEYFDKHFTRILEAFDSGGPEDEEEILVAFLMVIRDLGPYEDLSAAALDYLNSVEFENDIRELLDYKLPLVEATLAASSIFLKDDKMRENLHYLMILVASINLNDGFDLEYSANTYRLYAEDEKLNYKASFKVRLDSQGNFRYLMENDAFEKYHLLLDNVYEEERVEQRNRLLLLTYLLTDFLVYDYIKLHRLEDFVKDEDNKEDLWNIFEAAAKGIIKANGLM